MKEIDINTWNRRQHYEHFIALKDPYFAVTIPIDVTLAYAYSKDMHISFFAKYLHDCMKAINETENLKYRIVDEKVVAFDVIHASPTLMRSDNTYGFSFIKYHERLNQFLSNLKEEKHRIENSSELYPAEESSVNCIHCSALPWFQFSGHKEPVSGVLDSVPKLAFSKAETVNNKRIMHVAISVNHALVDGYHIGLFVEKFQKNLNS